MNLEIISNFLFILFRNKLLVTKTSTTSSGKDSLRKYPDHRSHQSNIQSVSMYVNPNNKNINSPSIDCLPVQNTKKTGKTPCGWFCCIPPCNVPTHGFSPKALLTFLEYHQIWWTLRIQYPPLLEGFLFSTCPYYKAVITMPESPPEHVSPRSSVDRERAMQPALGYESNRTVSIEFFNVLVCYLSNLSM